MFSIGDRVRWSSQASGTIKEKEGIIIEIIPIGNKPSKESYPRLYRGRDCGAPRKITSYIVKTEKGYYWPKVEGLLNIGSFSNTKSFPNVISRINKGFNSIPEQKPHPEDRIDLLKELKGVLY